MPRLLAFPVVVVRDRVEHAGVIVKAPPHAEANERGLVDVAYLERFANGTTAWRVLTEVEHLEGEDLPPEKGDVCYDVGAPDVAQRIEYARGREAQKQAGPALDESASAANNGSAGDPEAKAAADVGGTTDSAASTSASGSETQAPT